jgi:hypothetical protein
MKAVEMEMETAFKFQAQAGLGSEGAKFFVEKIETLGKKKLALKTEFERAEEAASNVISLDEVRQGLESRVEMVARGWRKFLPVQQKRVLRRLIEKIFISEKGLDIHYYFNALPTGKTSEALSMEVENSANVFTYRARGTKRQILNYRSKIAYHQEWRRLRQSTRTKRSEYFSILLVRLAETFHRLYRAGKQKVGR